MQDKKCLICIYGKAYNSLVEWIVCFIFAPKQIRMDPQVSNIISEYFKSQPVDKAWVFGSFSRNEERPESDVDILISLIPGTRLGMRFLR